MKLKWKEHLGKCKNVFMTALAVMFLLLSKITIYANEIENSTIGMGTIKLLNDLSSYMMVLLPIFSGLCGLYFFFRMNAADEQDQKRWKNRIVICVICAIGGVTIGGIIKAVLSYYQ